MVLKLLECKHCGTEYYCQMSGSNPNQHNEKQDDQYCHDCKTAIIEILSKIPKKFEYKFVPTTEVTIDQLLKWELEYQYEITKKHLFPLARKVFATLYKDGEYECASEVIGRDNFKGNVYCYRYWPSDKSNAKITVEKQINLETGEEVKYRYRRV